MTSGQKQGAHWRQLSFTKDIFLANDLLKFFKHHLYYLDCSEHIMQIINRTNGDYMSMDPMDLIDEIWTKKWKFLQNGNHFLQASSHIYAVGVMPLISYVCTSAIQQTTQCHSRALCWFVNDGYKYPKQDHLIPHSRHISGLYLPLIVIH